MNIEENKLEIIGNLISACNILSEKDPDIKYLCEIIILQELVNHFSDGKIFPKDIRNITCEEIIERLNI